jgi:type I restriction enzyme R subunit
MTSPTAIWNELHLAEEPAVELLEKLGYSYVASEDLLSERGGSERQVMLVPRLERTLRRLNPWLTGDPLRRAVRAITHVEATNLIEANEKAYVALTYGVAVEVEENGRRVSRTVRYFDFDDPMSNEFLVTRQYRVAGARRVIKPDVVVFVNGIPLAIIECKAPTLGEEWRFEATDQLERYQELEEKWHQQGAPQLFHTVQAVIGTCGQAACYGTVGAPGRSYLEWKTPHPLTAAKLEEILGRKATPQDVLLAGLLVPSNLLDLTRNFVVFEPEGGRIVKKIARYQQFRAVNQAIERVQGASEPKKRGGIIWHTQGSGKSLTMLWLAVKLRRLSELENPIIGVVTDRRDLDRQISGTFQRCGFPNPVQARSMRQLRDLLTSGPGQTVMTTIQKFQDATAYEGPRHLDGILTDATNVFVMVDEAHRTQYKNLAANMRRALPNACFFGFTGTPIDKRDRSTPRTFGSYVDTYGIQEAVDDGATVPIFYESRLPQVHVMSGETLDALFERIFSDYTAEEREAIKRHYATELAIAGAPRRIEMICLDIIDHYEKHIRPNGFKAQIVAATRDIAVTYKETLDRLHGAPSALIISFTNDDPERIARWQWTRDPQKELIDSFKQDPTDKLAFIIVCDMLLTGFDAPVEQVMYLDAPLREHTLLQAVARVNRPQERKTYGLVVDYWGVSEDLQDALAVFNAEEIRGALTPLEDELPEVQVLHRRAMRFFNDADRSDLDACVLLLEPEDRRAEFDAVFLGLARAMDMLLPAPQALPYVKDLQWLGKVRMAARARFREEHFDLKHCGEKVRKLISEHIGAERVEQLLKPVSILSSSFDEQVERLRRPEAKASEMEHAIRHEIKLRYEENPVFYQSLRDRLEHLIADRKAQRISAVEELKQLGSLLQNLRGVRSAIRRIGLTETSFAIYELILQRREGAGERVSKVAEEQAGYKAEVDEAAKSLARFIEEQLEELAVIDWTMKEDVQREMRRCIKRQLRAAGFGSDKIEALTSDILDVARRSLTT